MDNGNPLIQLKDLNKVFYTEETEVHAIASLDLEIHEGDFLAISGPSGCGKSTLLAILGLLDAPSRGEFWLKGTNTTSLSVMQRARLRNREIGFIFQSFNLIGDMTVFENVELPLTYQKIPRRRRRELVHKAIERVDMTHRMHHFPSQLSGGQQQRIAVARAAAGNPAILLADEPTGNLDSKSGDSVMQLLAELHRDGSTICMVTHDARYADYASRTIRLFDGKVCNEEITSAEAEVQ